MAQEPVRTWAQSFGPYLTMGIQLALAVVVFFFAGRWLDGQLGKAGPSQYKSTVGTQR